MTRLLCCLSSAMSGSRSVSPLARLTESGRKLAPSPRIRSQV